MNFKNLLPVLAITALIACEKSNEAAPGPTPPPPPTAPVQAPLLKDLAFSGLPSPYYHFEYDATGKAKFVSVAADFFRYNVHYADGKLSEMENNIVVNKDRLQYFYKAGKVEAINFADSTGKVFARTEFFYDGDKLIRIERPSGQVFLSYYADGNLSGISFNGQTLHYEQYDNKINVDGFSLLHEQSFSHFFLLPGVQLQKNNPGRETLTGAANSYTATYTYAYNDKNVPVNRKGDVLITGGANAGKRFETNASYSYY